MCENGPRNGPRRAKSSPLLLAAKFGPLAARRGHIESVDILLAGGADPNRVAQDNEVPLISAARLGFHQIVTSLLAAGADPEETDSTGRTAKDWATIMRLQQVLLALDKAEGAR